MMNTTFSTKFPTISQLMPLQKRVTFFQRILKPRKPRRRHANLGPHGCNLKELAPGVA